MCIIDFYPKDIAPHIGAFKIDQVTIEGLAEEAGLSSVIDVVSSILNNEHKELLADKKAERYIAAKNKAVIKEKVMV